MPLASGAGLSATNITGDYPSDVHVVLEAQEQALAQARQMLEHGDNVRDQAALQAAVQAMERSRAALEKAKKSPEQLTSAIAAEEAAFQALLKAIPREYRLSQRRNRNQSGSSAGQPGENELEQLDLAKEENRYESERQASAAPTEQQKEQAENVDRLKQLARRQQDLNERLRDLQTALQEARTDTEREEIQRQLKRLRDEERQMLSDVDEMRQRLEQSPNASRQAEARQQLEQTRSDVQRAAQELEHQSVSEALAAGARAEQNLQNLRENMRQQTSTQFANQMRQMRTQARDLANQENQIARDLESLNNSERKSLDNSAARQTLAEQMARQQGSLTNLLGQMRAVTEQAESTEPLLSKQLYDVIRRADQMHTENQLEIGSQLVERGFLPQASQAEHAAGQNIDELRQGVERAAESVLGSEADALRYAQKELDDLANQVAREMSAGTNSPTVAGNRSPRSGSQGNSRSNAGQRDSGTNEQGSVETASGTNSESTAQNGNRESTAQAGSQRGEQGRGQRAEGRNGSEQNQAQDSQNPANNGQAGSPGEQASSNQGQQPGDSPGGNDASSGESPTGNNARSGDEPSRAAGGGRDGGRAGGGDQLRQFAQDIGGAHGGLGINGPITGNNYVDWTERVRDVEQALDSADVRNQLATVRDRVGVYRRAYRQNGQTPSNAELQNKVLDPLTLARNWVGQELSRVQDDRSLVPLDRDPVQDKYSDLVRKYYEKLGSPQ